MSLHSVTLLLLLIATLCLCQNETDLDLWPQDAESASPRPGQYNFTYEIILDATPSTEYGLVYRFNISLGTPPQTVPVAVDITTSQVVINNVTSSPDEFYTERGREFYGYNPNLSSSSDKDYKTIVINNSSAHQLPSLELGFSLSETYVYTSDNYSIGALAFIPSLSFISFMKRQILFELPRGNETSIIEGNYTQPWHRVGFGVPEASAANYDKLKNNSQSGAYGGVIDDLRYGVGAIRSKSYSLWLDAPEDHSGHLLLGGLDTDAYTGPLTSLPTTIYTEETWIWSLPVLTVNTSFTSVTTSGQNQSLNLSLPVGITALTTNPNTSLPPFVAKAIWDALGADYKPDGIDVGYSELAQLVVASPRVPCSYLTNSSTLDFQFTGSNITVSVPMSDITIKRTRPGDDGDFEYCRLTIMASWGPGPSFLGADMLKNVYQVYDLDNNVVSVALTNFTSAGRNIVPIPEEGGVAAMNLSISGSSDLTSGSHGVVGLFDNILIFGIPVAVIVLGAAIF